MLPVINFILNCIGLVVIPILIVLGVIRQRTNPTERLKNQIILEIHKSLSQGEDFCHIYKMRDTIFQNTTTSRHKTPTLKFLLRFNQAIRELDTEGRIFRVDESEIRIESRVSYQSKYADTIKQYKLVDEKHLIYAIIPTYAKREKIIRDREQRRKLFGD